MLFKFPTAHRYHKKLLGLTQRNYSSEQMRKYNVRIVITIM